MDFCSIASGSSGNCIYVGSDQTSVLIDTGISRKRIVDGLHEIDRKPEELKGILITHEHSDHIKGLGVMSRKYHIPIYATAGTIDGIRNSTSLGQIDEDLFHTIRADGKFQIEDLEVEPVCHIARCRRAGCLSSGQWREIGCRCDGSWLLR